MSEAEDKLRHGMEEQMHWQQDSRGLVEAQERLNGCGRICSFTGAHGDAGGSAEDAQECVEQAGERLAVASRRVRSKQRHKALARLLRRQPRLHTRPILGQPSRQRIQRRALPHLRASHTPIIQTLSTAHAQRLSELLPPLLGRKEPCVSSISARAPFSPG